MVDGVCYQYRKPRLNISEIITLPIDGENQLLFSPRQRTMHGHERARKYENGTYVASDHDFGDGLELASDS